MKISTKSGAIFRNNEDGLFNPMNSILDEFIAEKGFKDKVKKKDFLKASLMSHLKDLQTSIVNNTEGIDLPNYLGKIQVMGFKPEKPGINWLETNKVFSKGKPKYIYYENNHTQGFTYKIYYRKSFNVTNGIKFALYKNKNYWNFESARLLNLKLKEKLTSNEDYFFHKVTKEYISNRKKYIDYKKIVKSENEW